MALGGPTVTLTFKGDAEHLKKEIASVAALVAGLGATVGILGVIGAAAATTVVGVAAVPLAFLGIGIAAAAQSEDVKKAFTAMKDTVIREVTRMAKPIQDELVMTSGVILKSFERISPALERIFVMSVPQLRIFVDGLLSLVERAMPGFETAIWNAMPLVESFGRGLGTLGEALGGFFAALTEGVPGAVIGFDALIGFLKDLLIYLGHLVGAFANSLGPAWAAIAPVLLNLIEAIGEGLIPLFQEMAPLVVMLANTFGDILIPIINALFTALARTAELLRNALGPVLPWITAQFNAMTPQIQRVATLLGIDLANAVDVVAMFIVDLVHLVLGLVEALLPLVPVLTDLARTLLPMLARVIDDYVLPAIRFLVDVIVNDLLPALGWMAGAVRETVMPVLSALLGLLGALVEPILRVAGALADVLLGTLAQLTDGLVALTPQIARVAEGLGMALADALTLLAPLILLVAHEVLNLIEALLPLVPPLVDLAHSLLPVLARVIEDVVLPVLRVLVNFLIAYVIPTIQAMADEIVSADTIWEGAWNAIVLAVTNAATGIRAGLQALADGVVADIGTIPGKILAIFGNAGLLLFDAGKAILTGLVGGLNSALPGVLDGVNNALISIRGLFPFSPAKEGPFSGSGYTEYSGRAMIEDFARGVQLAAPGLYAAIDAVLGGSSTGLQAAAGELLKRLAGGGSVYEDLSWAGMSANMAQYNDQLAAMLNSADSGLLAAIGELASVAARGGTIYEDLSYKGMSANLAHYNDQLAEIAYGRQSLQLNIGPGADSALASMLMNLVRTGQLQLARA